MYVNVSPRGGNHVGHVLRCAIKCTCILPIEKKYEGQLINEMLALTRAFHVYKDNHSN